MIKNFIKNNEFVKNLVTLISGTAIAQIIAVLFQLIVRRIYTPADFGAFAVYMSLVGIVATVVTLRYELAIVLPKKDKTAANVFFLSIIINFLFSLLLFIAVLIFKDKLVSFLNFPADYSYWLFFVPLSVFLFSLYQSINYWLIRKKAYKSSSINKIVRRSAEGSVQASFGYLKVPFGLVIGDFVGNIANNISGFYQILKNKFKFSYINKTELIYVLKRYKEFPKYNTFPALFNSISLLLPIILINKFYSQTLTGYFDLSRVVLAMPLALITTSLSQVLLQHISEKKNKHDSIKKYILNISVILFITALIGVTVFSLWSVNIFSFVFGENWIMSGEFTKILIFSYAIKFIVSPLSVIFTSLERIKIGSIWQFFYFCLIISLLFFRSFDILIFLKIYVIIDLIAYSVYFLLILFVSNQYEKSLKNK
ncbi:MAG: oligosaccharide flippase family protein [Bacteroidales bacterium]|nr:oligosaccharide flippase family protein [Bacteroidales bacterium]